MSTHEILVKCPNCQTALEAVTNASRDEHARPNGGDASYCVECGAVLLFNDDLTMREMTMREYLAHPPEQQLQIVHMWSTGQKITTVLSAQRKQQS